MTNDPHLPLLTHAFDYLSGFLTEERLTKITKQSAESSRFILPVLEDVYQFRNAAAIVRSVEACGFHQVVALQEKNVFEPNIRVTKGADTWVQVEKMPIAADSFERIKKNGYRLVAVTPEREATLLPDFQPTVPTALIFGTEWAGVSDQITELADETLAIPMYGFTRSFNVSVAAAICMYDLKQKLEKGNLDYKLNETDRLKLQTRWAIRSIRSGEEIFEKYQRENGFEASSLDLLR